MENQYDLDFEEDGDETETSSSDSEQVIETKKQLVNDSEKWFQMHLEGKASWSTIAPAAAAVVEPASKNKALDLGDSNKNEDGKSSKKVDIYSRLQKIQMSKLRENKPSTSSSVKKVYTSNNNNKNPSKSVSHSQQSKQASVPIKVDKNKIDKLSVKENVVHEGDKESTGQTKLGAGDQKSNNIVVEKNLPKYLKGGYSSLLDLDETLTKEAQKEAQILSSLSRPETSKSKRLIFDFKHKDNPVEVQYLRWEKLQHVILETTTREYFHMNSFSYDKYLQTRTPLNKLHANTQMDDITDKSTQTSTFEVKSKWTQKNPYCSKHPIISCKDFSKNYQDAHGVGDFEESSPPVAGVHSKQFRNAINNRTKINRLVKRSSDLVIGLMELQKRKRPQGTNQESRFIFSRGLPAIENLESHDLKCSGELIACSNRPQLTVNKDSDSDQQHQFQGSKSIITIWTVKEQSNPCHILRVWGQVTSLNLDSSFQLVVAGLNDGSLNLWNLEDPIVYQKQVQQKFLLSPSISTSCMEMKEFNLSNHVAPIVDLEIMNETPNCSQLISLDKTKKLIVWGCIKSDSLNNDKVVEQNAAWTKLRLIIRNIINLEETFSSDLLCFTGWSDNNGTNLVFGTDMCTLERTSLWTKDPFILRIESETKGVIKIHSISFNRETGLVAGGCDDAYCRIFDVNRKEVIALPCIGIPLKVIWSKRRMSLLYIALENRIEVWDLAESDSIPSRKIPANGLKEFDIYATDSQEYIAKISNNQVCIEPIPGKEIKPLKEREKSAFRERLHLNLS